jgi:hypothetical protein
MTTQSGLQSRQQRRASFAQCGQITSNAAKGLGESLAPEATGDLLLHTGSCKDLAQPACSHNPHEDSPPEEDRLLVGTQPIQPDCGRHQRQSPFFFQSDHHPTTCSYQSNTTARNQGSFKIAMTDAIQITLPPAIRSRRAGTCRYGGRVAVARWRARW